VKELQHFDCLAQLDLRNQVIHAACCRLETISPHEFPNWIWMHWLKTASISYMDAKGFFGLVLGVIPLGEKITHTPSCPHAKKMKACESRFHNNWDLLLKYI